MSIVRRSRLFFAEACEMSHIIHAAFSEVCVQGWNGRAEHELFLAETYIYESSFGTRHVRWRQRRSTVHRIHLNTRNPSCENSCRLLDSCCWFRSICFRVLISCASAMIVANWWCLATHARTRIHTHTERAQYENIHIWWWHMNNMNLL